MHANKGSSLITSPLQGIQLLPNHSRIYIPKPSYNTFPHFQINGTSSNSSSCTHNLAQQTAVAATALLLSAQALLAPAAMAVPPPVPPMTTLDTVIDLPPLPTEFPPLREPSLPRFKKFQLRNGLRVILLEDHEAPLLRGVLFMRGGERANAPDQLAMATIAAAVQRAGGSTAHPEQAFDDSLEALAASIEGGSGPEAITMGFECLSSDAAQVLQLFSEVITSPAVPIKKLDLLKLQAENALAHKNDDAKSLPTREASKLIYGENSLWAREPTIAQVQRLQKEDVEAWLKTWERPDTAVLGIVGDFSPAQLRQTLEDTLGKQWQAPAAAAPSLPSENAPDMSAIAGKLFLIDRPGATQASIATAEVGVQLMDPDEASLDVLSSLLNSFGGKLFDGIRSRDGLAYTVGGGWPSAPVDHPGLFIASAETAKPVELLVALRQALDDAATVPPSADLVERAKEESLNSFIFGFVNTSSQLRRATGYELFGIPQEYPFKYREKLRKVTAADVAAAARKHLHPQSQVTVVVGDAKVLQPQLEKALGVTVELLDVDNES